MDMATVMFSCKVDNNVELRLIEPRHAEALNALIEQNISHIKKWSTWLRDDRSIENTHGFIKRNLKHFANREGFAGGIWFLVKWWDKSNTTISIGKIEKPKSVFGSANLFRAKVWRQNRAVC